MDSEDPFLHFLDNSFDTIEGWPGSRESVRFMQVFRSVFERCSEASGACEIGVHHGKYLIALHNLLDGQKRSLGIDLFDDQSKNIDCSGIGSLEICASNI